MGALLWVTVSSLGLGFFMYKMSTRASVSRAWQVAGPHSQSALLRGPWPAECCTLCLSPWSPAWAAGTRRGADPWTVCAFLAAGLCGTGPHVPFHKGCTTESSAVGFGSQHPGRNSTVCTSHCRLSDSRKPLPSFQGKKALRGGR